jgi:hypothetical protein
MSQMQPIAHSKGKGASKAIYTSMIATVHSRHWRTSGMILNFTEKFQTQTAVPKQDVSVQEHERMCIAMKLGDALLQAPHSAAWHVVPPAWRKNTQRLKHHHLLC